MKLLSIFSFAFFALASTSKAQQAMGPWKNTGPVNFPTNESSTNARGIGRVSQIKFHPTNNQTMYAVSASGGLFISNNNGQTWNPSGGTDKLPRTSCSAICIDYSNDQILYLGLGDANYYNNGSGIYKSTDGGLSWNPANNGMGNRMAVEILMDPANHNNIVAATDGGIWKSTDAGASWTLKQSGAFRDMKTAPGNNNKLYASTATAFYTSNDFGNTWSQITNGVTIPGSNWGTRIAVSAANPSVVYLITAFSVSSGGCNGTVMRSNDGGASFTTVYNNPNQCLVCYDVAPSSNSQCDYNLDITCNPQNANELLLVAQCVWRSTDGGVTWSKRTDWPVQMHTDMHQIEFNPYNNAQRFCANDGGVWLSTDTTAQTWSQRSDGIAASEIYHMAQNPTNSGIIDIGLQDNGEVYLKNNTWRSPGGADWGAKMVFDYTTPGNVYYLDAGTRKNITQDNNTPSYNSPFTPNNNATLEFVPSMPNTAFIGYMGLWRSSTINTTNVTWTQIQSNTETVMDIASCRADSNILYYVTALGHIFRSDNALSATPTFVQMNTPASCSITASIATKKSDPNVVFLSCNAGIFRSADKGATWTNITGTGLSGANIRKIIHDDYSTNERLFVNADNYVHYKDNTTTAWTNHSSNQGLPSICSVSEMMIYNVGDATSVLRLATYGRGVWECNINNSAPYDLLANPFIDTTALPATINQLAGTVLGSTGSYDGTSTRDKAFDNNTSTYFDAPAGAVNGQWVGLDLGTSQNIRYIKFRPRQSFENRMQGGLFQISTDAAFTNPVTIYQVPNSTLSFRDYYIASVDPNGMSARYVRYLSPDNGYGNVAEITVMTAVKPVNNSFVSSAAVTGTQLTGTVLGSTGSYDGTSTRDKAFDNNTSTYFDAPAGAANGQWVGLDLGTSQNIRYIKFRPRQSFENRMQGGLFQISTDANFTNPITVYQIPGSTLSFQDYYIASVDTNGAAARYVRYLSPNNGYGNVAEITVMTAVKPVNNSFVSSAAVTGTQLTGTVLGSTGSYDGTSTRDKAFDNNTSTYFDAPAGSANGQWVGLDLGTSQNIRYIKFRPRQSFENRMQGGLFQISTDANFTNPITVYQIPGSTLSFQDYYIASVDPNGVPARYVRYLSPNNGYGNVAEVTVMTGTSTPVVAATFYSDCNYGGTAVSLPLGNYDINDLISDGIGNDQLSSLKVSGGYKVTLYSDAGYSGYPLGLTSDDACLGDYSFDNITSSIKITSLATARMSGDESGFNVLVSPNPAPGNVQLHIEDAEDGEMNLRVVNLQGQTIINKTEILHAGSNSITLERGLLPAGIYIIKTTNGGNAATTKVVFE
ncbi:discoidin domain-containing protein [Taibaiella soli]|uniref:F5/8 type C domain-containing protein n=1 Tax=Taibaiella soli TaxID=1649169 RepID=A0A2W2AAX1_9BACT|nr:discoidin domain-containing protein [Taibaiella soli]PZF72535.1 hypothetical protein DN068_11765 [Taibaiella soli]